MTWVAGIALVLIVLGMFGDVKKKPKSRKGKTFSGKKRAGRLYATIYENDEHRPVTSDQVAAMFADIRKRLKDYQTTAKAMTKLAENFLETGSLDVDAYAVFSDAEKEVEKTLAEAEALIDKLYFESDTATERYHKLVDDLYEVEAEITYARDTIVSVQEEIEEGEFVPQIRAKPKSVKKPPKGATPNIRMLYHSLSGNEGEWTILITSRTGKTSFRGWSFEHDRDFSFNTVGVLWADDLLTGQRISDFPAHLDSIAPLDGKRTH